MPKSKTMPPKHSRTKLAASLNVLSNLKDQHPKWVSLATDRLSADHALYPHAVYGVQLNELLAGKPFQTTVRRTGWLYFLRDQTGRLACAELTAISGRHQNVRISEGVFVRKLFRRINTLKKNSRIGRRPFSLKSIRVEALHLFCLWLEISGKDEFFIPIAHSGAFRGRRCISREDLAKLLRTDGQRIRQAQTKMKSLVETYQ